jgi:hypothetical protein
VFEPLWVVPIQQQPNPEPQWIHVCAACWRELFGTEPPEQFHRALLGETRRRRFAT